MKINGNIILIFLLIVAIIFSIQQNCISTTSPEIIEKTIIKTDTIIKYKPVHDTVYLSKYIVDTLKIKGDTVYKEVEIPIYTKVYKDSTYEAQISGYKAKLDYIKIYPKTYTVYKEKFVKSPKKRFNWGIQSGIGYGVINKKPDLYLGVGLQYNF